MEGGHLPPCQNFAREYQDLCTPVCTQTHTYAAVEACGHWQRWITTWRHTRLQRMYTALPWITEQQHSLSNCDNNKLRTSLWRANLLRTFVFSVDPIHKPCLLPRPFLWAFHGATPFPTCVNRFSFSSREDGSCTCLGGQCSPLSDVVFLRDVLRWQRTDPWLGLDHQQRTDGIEK